MWFVTNWLLMSWVFLHYKKPGFLISECENFTLQEKDLIPKLFEVLAPRYEKYQTAFTSLYMLPVEHPGINKMMGILELKGMFLLLLNICLA